MSLFNLFLIIVNTYIPYVLSMVLYCTVFESRRRYSMRGTVLKILAGMPGIMAIAVLILHLPDFMYVKTFYVVIYLAIPFLFGTLLFQCTLFENLFVFFIIKCYLDSLFTIAKISQVYVVARVLKINNQWNFVISYAIIWIFSFLAIFWFMKYPMRKLIMDTKHMAFWKFIWWVPVTSYLVYQFGISPDYQRTSDVLGRTKIFLPVIWITGTFLTFVIIVKMLIATAEAERENARLKIVNQQISMMEEQYKKMQQNIEESRREKHDLRHQILALKEFSDRQDYGKLRGYLEELTAYHINRDAQDSVCENNTLDAIAGHYLCLAKEHEVLVDSAIHIPEDIPFREMDIGIVFGNLLENAYEACVSQTEGKRYIRVRADFVSSTVLGIVVENSYGGVIKEKRVPFSHLRGRAKGSGSIQYVISLTSIKVSQNLNLPTVFLKHPF